MTKHLLLALCIPLALARPTYAQTGRLSGTVVDESGAVVPGATVTLTGPTRGVTTSGPRGEYEFRSLASGTYQIAVALPGFAPVTVDNIVVGTGAATVPPISLVLGGFGEVVVVSAARVETKLVEAPATMSVIPGATLAAIPAQNYGDVLRTVPGMNVIQLSARDVNVTSRQATSTLATSQLALVDGRSIYLDFFGLILWDFVPTNPDDIKQIEVVRGPASAVWGANALTGVVNIITKSPRESPGTRVTFNAGFFDRDVGSTQGRGVGATFGAGVTTSQTPNDRWSYRISAGYFNSDPYARPTGRIPVIPDPRDPTGRTTVGGATYPADAQGPLGTAFQNRGTSQPKFDVRVDQELTNARVTYAGGVGSSEGTIYTGIGPFDIQSGSVVGYGRLGYTRGALRFQAFTNIVDAEAPNLLVPDPATGRPLLLNFKTATYDVELGHAVAIGTRHAVSYGGNYRRNNFDITLAPTAKDRNEVGAYAQDEIIFDRFRFSIGGRVDKFGNIEDPVFSPRLSAIFHPAPDHSLRVSFNRAFRSPSTVNNYLDIALVNPVDLRALAPLVPPPLQPFFSQPFPLIVKAVGSELPIGGRPQPALREESLTAYELAYTGTIGRTTLGAAFYINDKDDDINFVQLRPNVDPYTASSPPPGWPAAAAPILALMAQLNIFLPRTAFTYQNLGPVRYRGVELSVDHQVNSSLSAYANYSWQDDAEILDDPTPFPAIELAIPPTNRFNAGVTHNGPRFLAAANVNYTDKAFWSDVLISPFHGFTDDFTMVNGSFGVKWNAGRITTSVKSMNIFNQTIQQHVFGDLLRRSVTFEVKLAF